MKLQRKEKEYYYPVLNPVKKKKKRKDNLTPHIGQTITIPQDGCHGGKTDEFKRRVKREHHSCQQNRRQVSSALHLSCVLQKFAWPRRGSPSGYRQRETESLSLSEERIKRDCVSETWHVLFICKNHVIKSGSSKQRALYWVRSPESQPQLCLTVWPWASLLLPLSAP